MAKAGKPGPVFSGTCERCGCHSERCKTVLYLCTSLHSKYRELRIYCPGCRKATAKNWRWPEPTSKDAQLEKDVKFFERYNKS